MLSNRGSCRVQNLGRRADLWMRNCSQKHTLLPSFPEQESSVQTIGMNQRVFNFSLRRLPRTEQQVKAFLSSSSVSSSISLIPSPSPLEWSSDSEESTAATELLCDKPGGTDLRFHPGSSASYSPCVLEWVSCPISLTQNLHLWMGSLEWTCSLMHQEYPKVFY